MGDVVDKVALLQATSLFTGISAKDLEELAQTLSIKKFKARQLIFRQGDFGSTLYIVAKGQVNIYLPASPDDLPLQTLQPGEYFGELALFDNQPRSASALAVTPVVLLELTQPVLMRCMAQRPNLALSLLRSLATRLRATNALLSERAARNVDEEVEKQLTWQDRLADRVAELNGSWVFISGLIGITLIWMLLNTRSFLTPTFDPYPFVFFNLILAILVALQGPLIMMSQNRQALKDRTRSETDYRVNLKNEVNIEMLLQEVRRFGARFNHRLDGIEKNLHLPQGETKLDADRSGHPAPSTHPHNRKD